MARLWMQALSACGAHPFLASRFCSRDGLGDNAAQAALVADASLEVERILAGPRPAAWLTYHNYYKAPDLVGPAVAARLAIPYIVAEGSSAARRARGPHALFAGLADTANRAADAHLVLNGRDVAGLTAIGARCLTSVRPFIDLSRWPARRRFQRTTGGLLACAAMMRAGDKLASYRLLAESLALAGSGWQLQIAGDGPARTEVEALFAPFGNRVMFLGQADDAALGALFRQADLLVWPGVNEAFGMVYLEAAASGCPSLAMDYGGVAGVVADGVGGVLVPAGDRQAYARVLARLLADPAERIALGRQAAHNAAARHGVAVAADHLGRLLHRLGVKEHRICAS